MNVDPYKLEALREMVGFMEEYEAYLKAGYGKGGDAKAVRLTDAIGVQLSKETNAVVKAYAITCLALAMFGGLLEEAERRSGEIMDVGMN